MKFLSSKVHTIIGLVVGVLLIAAPWIFGFADVDAAMWVAVIIGAIIVLSELTSTSPASPIKLVPMRVHLWMDVGNGVVLAISPWIFGFADEGTNAWLPHLIVGILVVGYALVTNPADATITDRPAVRGPRSTGTA